MLKTMKKKNSLPKTPSTNGDVSNMNSPMTGTSMSSPNSKATFPNPNGIKFMVASDSNDKMTVEQSLDTTGSEQIKDGIVGEMYKKLNNNVEIKNFDKTKYHSFDNMNLNKNILKGIYEGCKWSMPSPIQAIGIMPLIKKRNLLCQSQTGTGKTGTYMIAALQNINQSEKNCQVIILAPTRELVQQIYNVGIKLGMYTDIKFAAHYSSYSTSSAFDKNAIDDRGVQYMHNVTKSTVANSMPYTYPIYKEHVLVATTGKLKNIVHDNSIGFDTSHISLVIMDEADNLLQHNFLTDIINVFEKIENEFIIALYSATISNEIREISTKFMKDPVQIRVLQDKVAVNNQSHYFAEIDQEEQKDEILKEIFSNITIGQAFVFCNRIFKIKSVVDTIESFGIPVVGISSEIEQEARNKAIDLFRKKEKLALVATNVVARGIDTTADVVINYDIPENAQDYVHRSGRTGRFGGYGSVINIVNKNEMRKFNTLLSQYSIEAKKYTVLFNNH